MCFFFFKVFLLWSIKLGKPMKPTAAHWNKKNCLSWMLTFQIFICIHMYTHVKIKLAQKDIKWKIKLHPRGNHPKIDDSYNFSMLVHKWVVVCARMHVHTHTHTHIHSHVNTLLKSFSLNTNEILYVLFCSLFFL